MLHPIANSALSGSTLDGYTGETLIPRPDYVRALDRCAVFSATMLTQSMASTDEGWRSRGAAMDLICYLRSGWEPMIRPAEPTREWMDHTRYSFAYRCLPLNIANSHGWEILCPVAFDAIWHGGPELSDVVVRVPPDTPPAVAPVSAFGEGVLTFHINGLFRTPPGWNLWVGGSPNAPKDGIYPLTGVIETDWSPYTFTMNWRFTRPRHPVHFDAGEPICFIFPVQREVLPTIQPRFLPIEAEPQLADHHAAFDTSRKEFLERMRREHRTVSPVDQWQKRYYRGVDMTEQPVVPDHRAKLRLAPFAPVTPEAVTVADPNAPVILQTDTATLGRALGEVIAAIKSGAADADSGADALAKRLAMIGLGPSEALEVIWAAMDWAEADADADADADAT